MAVPRILLNGRDLNLISGPRSTLLHKALHQPSQTGVLVFCGERSVSIGNSKDDRAAREWRELEARMERLAETAMGLPAAALRPDLAVMLMAGKFLPGLLPYLPYTMDLSAPFSKMVDQVYVMPSFPKCLVSRFVGVRFTLRVSSSIRYAVTLISWMSWKDTLITP